MSLSLRKLGTGRHLGFVLLAWVIFLLIAALLLPPLDSHLQPGSIVGWGVVMMAILLALTSMIIVPAYLYRSWLRLPTVSNRTAYGLWISFESLLLLAMLLGVAFLFLTKFM